MLKIYWEFTIISLLFGYFQQDKSKIEFLARRLCTRLQFEFFYFSHEFPNFQRYSVFSRKVGNC